MKHSNQPLLVSALIVAGCASVDPARDYERAAKLIAETTGQETAVDPAHPGSQEAVIQEILREGLSSDEAVQLCLLNNPRLQADFLRIGIGRAEVVQSGLFSNPSLALSVRFPDEGGLANLGVSLAQNIAELWQLPVRKTVAKRELDETILTIVREASALALETRAAYVQVQKVDRELAILREILSLMEEFVELSLARARAGSASSLEVNFASAERAALLIEQRRAQLALDEARSKLATLLGLTTSPQELVLTEDLGEPSIPDLSVEQILTAARRHRLDLRAAGRIVDAAAARISLERRQALETLDFGITFERTERRPSDRGESVNTLLGPTVGLELPLFDQNQAQVARAEYEFLQARWLVDAIERELALEAWTAHQRSSAAFENSRFLRNDLVPLRENGLELAREGYRAGGATILAVLEAQRTLLQARDSYVETLAEASLAEIALERVAGLPLSRIRAEPSEPKSTDEDRRP